MADELEDLLSSTASGDRDAFAVLYERTSAKMFGIVLRILKDRARSEDVLAGRLSQGLAESAQLRCSGGPAGYMDGGYCPQPRHRHRTRRTADGVDR